jgi:hypothetical protein
MGRIKVVVGGGKAGMGAGRAGYISSKSNKKLVDGGKLLWSAYVERD